MELEIAQMLVLSTAHLTEHTCNLWLCGTPGVWFHKGDYGWFIYVPTEENESEGDHPRCLADCWEYARRHGCLWIMFDRDGDTVTDLPVYKW